MTSFVLRKPGISSSAIKHQDATLRYFWKHQVHDFDTGRFQKLLDFVGIRDNLRFCSLISFRQIAPHEVEAEFCQASFFGDRSYRLFVQPHPFSIVEIFHVVILIFGVSYPVWISILIFKNVSIYCTMRPDRPFSGSYRMTSYSYNSKISLTS